MALITKLTQLVSGVARNVDISANTLVVDNLQIYMGNANHLTFSGSLTANRTITMPDANVNLADVNNAILKDGSRAFTADQSLGGFKLTNVADPAAAQDAATKAYVDSQVSGGGQVKISASDTTSEYLDTSLTAGAGLSKSITNPGANEQLDLSVNVDDSTIEINADALRLKALGITDSHISGSAAIAYSKLNLSASIVNADIASGAAIAYSKLSLAASIVNADIASGAAIAESKLALDYSTSSLNTAISDHLSDASDAHDASAISSVPAGNLASTDVQAALNELDSEKVAKSGDTMSGDLAMGGNKVTGLAAATVAGDAVRYEQAILASGANAFTADQSMGSNKLTNVADPTTAQDAATKSYVDAMAQGLKPKAAVLAASTGPVTLSSQQTVDGVIIYGGQRVLIKDQASAAENGIYISAAGAWTRATDFDSLSPIDEINGAYVFVQSGTQAGQGWVQTGVVSTLGTDPVNFVYFNDAAAVIGGDMVTVTGQTISVDLATTSGLESTNAGNAAGQLRVKLEASNPSLMINGSNELAAKLDAAGALASGASGLAVQVDNSSIEISTNALQVKALGITNAMLAGSISDSKLSTITTANKVSGSAIQLATDAGLQDNTGLELKLDGSTLSKSASGVKVATGGITNTEVNASAAIAYSKLNLSASIVDADVASGAAIAYSKLSLSNSIVAGDLTTDAVTTAKIQNAAVTEAKLAASVAGDGLTGGAGSPLAIGANADGSIVVNSDDIQVASAPLVRKTVTAGENFNSNTSYLVRFAMNGETAGRIYKADQDASSLDKFYVVGVMLSTINVNAGQPVKAIMLGTHVLGSSDSAFSASDIGKPVFLTASGAFSVTAPTTTNYAVVRVGVVEDTDRIFVSPQVMYIN